MTIWRTTVFSGVCAVMLGLAGVTVANVQHRLVLLEEQRDALREQVAAQQETLDVLVKREKEIAENARIRNAQLTEALRSAGSWSDDALPDSVLRMLRDGQGCDLQSPSGSHGGDGASR